MSTTATASVRQLKGELSSQIQHVTSTVNEAVVSIEAALSRDGVAAATSLHVLQEQLFTVLFVHWRKQLFDSFGRFMASTFPDEHMTMAVKSEEQRDALLSFHKNRIAVLQQTYRMRTTPVVSIVGLPEETTARYQKTLLALGAGITTSPLPHLTTVIVCGSAAAVGDVPGVHAIRVAPHWVSDCERVGKLVSPVDTRYEPVASPVDHVDSAVRRFEKEMPPAGTLQDDRELELQRDVSALPTARSGVGAPPRKFSRRDLKLPDASNGAGGKSGMGSANTRTVSVSMASVAESIAAHDAFGTLEKSSRQLLPAQHVGVGMTAESQVVQFRHVGVQDARGALQKRIDQKCIQFTVSTPSGPHLDAVVALGGAFDVSPSYSTRATHLVVCGDQQPGMKSEKFMAFVVKGKWVVWESYLHECHKQAAWLPEEAFEVHRPDSIAREIRVNSGVPFAGWNVLLLTPRQLRQGLSVVLREGGCGAVYLTPDTCDGALVTHVLSDTNEPELRIKASDVAAVPRERWGVITGVTLEYLRRLVCGGVDDAISGVVRLHVE